MSAEGVGWEVDTASITSNMYSTASQTLGIILRLRAPEIMSSLVFLFLSFIGLPLAHFSKIPLGLNGSLLSQIHSREYSPKLRPNKTT